MRGEGGGQKGGGHGPESADSSNGVGHGQPGGGGRRGGEGAGAESGQAFQKWNKVHNFKVRMFAN